jgi:hypothetical protein
VAAIVGLMVDDDESDNRRSHIQNINLMKLVDLATTSRRIVESRSTCSTILLSMTHCAN